MQIATPAKSGIAMTLLQSQYKQARGDGLDRKQELIVNMLMINE
jgi:hypothetical protein